MITKLTATTKCDARDCKNTAEFAFEIKGRQGRCYLCKDCVQRLLESARKLLTPKSPTNAIKKHLDRKVEEQTYVGK